LEKKKVPAGWRIGVRRRDFIKVMGVSVTLWPLTARAQQRAMPVVGYLGIETPERFAPRLGAFRQGLAAAGYEEGRNVRIEYRWAEGHPDRLPALAGELVSLQVDLIATPGSIAAALAAKAATKTIPIVFESGADVIAAGLVNSLNRPGGNITGVTSLNIEIDAKRLDLLRELVPAARSFAVLLNPANPVSANNLKNLKAPAGTPPVQLHFLNASTENELDAAFAKLAQLRVGGVLIGSDPFFNNRLQRFAALTLKHATPAIQQGREFAVAGGLMSYGGDIRETHRQAGIYTGRVLKGERPADLPVQQVTKVELVINLKTAKAFGINVPNTLIGRADEVIE
jgi:putative ABC transport system substrate-binding protein